MGTLHFRRIERRRTARVALSVDLIVHGDSEAAGKFKIEGRTVSVSLHGGMMVLEPEVSIGQKLILINTNSGQKTECRVVAAKPGRDGKRYVAFEFTATDINFWKMCFPVPGTKPMRRSMKPMLASVPVTENAR